LIFVFVFGFGFGVSGTREARARLFWESRESIGSVSIDQHGERRCGIAQTGKSINRY
jgi:hypothetical protein